MAKEEIPNWFVWTTTLGLGLVVILLWLNYSALTNLGRASYAMMQANADMNMMNAGMMRMMTNSMMKNNMMTASDFQKIDQLYTNISETNQYMRSMMNDGTVDANEYSQMMQSSANIQSMMGGMMK